MLYNDELHACPDIIRIIKSRRLKQGGHCVIKKFSCYVACFQDYCFSSFFMNLLRQFQLCQVVLDTISGIMYPLYFYCQWRQQNISESFRCMYSCSVFMSLAIAMSIKYVSFSISGLLNFIVLSMCIVKPHYNLHSAFSIIIIVDVYLYYGVSIYSFNYLNQPK